MNAEQQAAILAIGLYAAFSDGAQDEREREAVRRIAESLAADAEAPELSRVVQDVLLKRTRLDDAIASLQDTAHRQLAFEMAVCVCDADGRQTEAERAFLADLRQRLRLDAGAASEADAFERQANEVAALGEAVVPVAGVAAGAMASVPASGPVVANQPRVPESEIDRSILNYALLNGALELLPQSWASMAIIPFQVKMVYGVGKSYGVELDQGHIKEFIAAAGVGLTSQYVEQFGRKLLGGLLGKMAGKAFGRIGGAATGMAFSFATTYALGHLAKRYYAGGRVMNGAVLRETYEQLLAPARQMQAQYLPQMRDQAASLDAGRIMGLLRGG
jgi:uncharacterized protein (DUF697 family)/tellurite resistance protein